MNRSPFDTLTRNLADGPTRRGVLRGFLSAGLGLGAIRPPEVAEAKPCPPCRKRKRGKCKRKSPNGSPCAGGSGVCEGGICFPRGICPPGTQACVPPSGTTCNEDEDCFCATSAQGNTVCIESGGLCISFSNNDCQTAAECSTCQANADCAKGQVCIDISGCCDDFLNRTVPLPAGAKTCVNPCLDPAK